MVHPSGDQYEISAAGYSAVVTEGGAALRRLTCQGRDLVRGFGEDEMSSGGRGQLLMPWPNRIRDGRYSFEGRDLQLGLTDPGTGNASHGLVRWASWTVEEHTDTSVSLVCRVLAQTGYPWALDLHVLYDLSADGLVVTQTATNLSPDPAPYASGAHPYLCVGDAIEDLELHVPAHHRVQLDERQLPAGVEPVAGPYDFTSPRRIGDTVLDDCWGGLDHEDGRATVTLLDPASGDGVALWVDGHHRWLQLYTAPSDGPRPALAVEPMTAPADAFNSGTDLVTLAPAGTRGDELSVSWGIHAV
ncbi:aldose 1-epimerase family protein [Nocardioides hwasunensis]|uniref:Aldose 1-epimerase family protein n=1 Tax=Nocardioides hwasunensis TaxID=397258 RepID=A0ABR8MF91_9ACTN|nr:aldose 1-epimerase family protein [Nocardioides hwasunensis]MBD3913746.1 aldose 1-epimerase family protein [Nocardioides hwasunensis]